MPQIDLLAGMSLLLHIIAHPMHHPLNCEPAQTCTRHCTFIGASHPLKRGSRSRPKSRPGSLHATLCFFGGCSLGTGGAHPPRCTAGCSHLVARRLIFCFFCGNRQMQGACQTAMHPPEALVIFPDDTRACTCVEKSTSALTTLVNKICVTVCLHLIKSLIVVETNL